MDYTERSNQLKEIFSFDKTEMNIPSSRVMIVNSIFCSAEPQQGFFNSADIIYSENRLFSYPVFVPENKESNRLILLFHGLNERSWTKYLAWALSLAEDTGSYVILFPIAFHINRSPVSWTKPRVMSHEVRERLSSVQNIRLATFANVALSKRLTTDPRRFFFSGYRTATDIIKLLEDIGEGRHELIPASRHVNIFSYSIGAFLAEILMIANPNNLFSNSKLFIFCGGSVFSRMNGTSKLIMDSLAYDRIFSYFMKDFEVSINPGNPLSGFFSLNRLGLAFRSMIDIERLRNFRERALNELRERICAITLQKDRIIPPAGIISTLDNKMTGCVQIADFPYEYSHENPFPVTVNRQLSSEIDNCFKKIMTRAAEFLC